MKCVIVSNRPWNINLAKKLTTQSNFQFYYIKQKDELTLANLSSINPQYIFFPHWSYIIPKEIHENYNCVIFHMTDLPFGRGGSPLQNLISKGIYETKITALKCTDGIDSGPIYLKKPLSLFGTAEEIYIRASKVIEEMILEIMLHQPPLVEQKGKIVNFKRRTVNEGNIATLEKLEQVFDYIRMLDAEGYPRAFLETEYFKFEFERASLKTDCIIADVKITRK